MLLLSHTPASAFNQLLFADTMLDMTAGTIGSCFVALFVFFKKST
jgi:hypothetical protein